MNNVNAPATADGSGVTPEENTCAPQTKRKCIVLALLIALVLAAASFATYMAMNANPYDQSASTLQTYNGTHDEIVAQLDEITRASQLWIAVASSIQVDAATGTCSIPSSGDDGEEVLSNIDKNTKDLTYTITLDDGTVVYESGLIAPGQSLVNPVLTTIPASGTYAAVATAQGYDPETHEPTGGTVAAEITMTVA